MKRKVDWLRISEMHASKDKPMGGAVLLFHLHHIPIIDLDPYGTGHI
jgi:hypothetical protein